MRCTTSGGGSADFLISGNLFTVSQVFKATNGSVSERQFEWGVGTARVQANSQAEDRDEFFVGG